jgi:hypothetical protein
MPWQVELRGEAHRRAVGCVVLPSAVRAVQGFPAFGGCVCAVMRSLLSDVAHHGCYVRDGLGEVAGLPGEWFGELHSEDAARGSFEAMASEATLVVGAKTTTV